MRIRRLHRWDLDYADAVELQNRLRGALVQSPVNLGRVNTVAGVDVSCSRQSSLIHAAIVVLRLPALSPIESSRASVEVPFPYIPGLLSFREGPAVIAAFEGLGATPDAVIFDGQGYAHPRRLGLAAHLGLWLGVPTVGCAKTRLTGEHEPAPADRGKWSSLKNAGEEIGAVLRTREGVKPVFVSRGHLCDLPSAVALVTACLGGCRLPETTRHAHRLCNQVRKDRER